jgi:branched-chain amino acid transport system ATP-binding protein
MSLCETITVIDFGKEIAAGRPDEIKNNPEVIKAYLGTDKR